MVVVEVSEHHLLGREREGWVKGGGGERKVMHRLLFKFVDIV